MTKQKENLITSTCHKKKPLTEGTVKRGIKNHDSNTKPIGKPPAPKPSHETRSAANSGSDNTEQDANLGGRPPLYDNPDEFNTKVNEYFDTGCKQVTIGFDKDNNEVKIKKYTINGLTLFLGFSSKQSLYEYGKKPGFIDPIKKARTMIEQMYEEMLASKYSTGAIFALKNMGWKDEQGIKHSGETVQKTIEISKKEYAKIRAEMIKNDSC